MAVILLVEDHDDVLGVLQEAVVSAGHQAECVRTLAEAERAFALRLHDLVISDVVLPDGYGYEVAKRARTRGRRAILISGDPEQDSSDVPGASQGHGALHLRKPFRLSDLLTAIETTLAA